jgi:hypothetical protein
MENEKGKREWSVVDTIQLHCVGGTPPSLVGRERFAIAVASLPPKQFHSQFSILNSQFFFVHETRPFAQNFRTVREVLGGNLYLRRCFCSNKFV